MSQSESSEFVWQETISGTVTDAATGEALPGVNIVIQGTDRGTATDVDGRCRFQVPSLDQGLVFTYIGDRKSTRLNSSHVSRSYAVFCSKKLNQQAIIDSCFQ